jgi:long-chain acyl-CoA synthetase
MAYLFGGGGRVVYRLLKRQTRCYGNKTAIIGERRTLSYRDLLREVDQAAVHLQSLNLGEGAVVMLGMSPSPEFYVVFYAAAALGLTAIPVLPSGKISQVIVDANPAIAVGDAGFLREATKFCPALRHAILWDRENGLGLAPEPSCFVKNKTLREEPVVGVSSSGTTGTPSIYYRSAELLVRRSEFRAEALGIGPDDVLLSARPYNSGSSINSHVVMPVVAGCSIVVQEKFRRFQAAAAIAEHKVTVLYSVPFIFELLASIPKSCSYDFRSLRLCISGSAPLSKAVADAFLSRFGVEIRQRYGGSHIHPAFTFNARGVPQSVGQTSGPFPIAILDEAGNSLEANTIGELAFDFARIPRAWKKHLRTNPNRRGRYIFTGDLGRTDVDGNVFIVGRKSRFIKVKGNRVEPAEVEEVLRSHPKVKEAFVFAVHPGQPDEQVGAVVATTEPIEEETLVQYCARQIEGYKCPRRIEVRTTLPRNEHGKVARFQLEENLQGSALEAAQGGDSKPQ